MASPSTLRGVGAVIFGAALLIAQVPSHAVLLNPTAWLATPRLARAGAVVHAVGITEGADPYFIHYARSTDGGRTWPLREVPLAYALALGDLVVDGPNVHVVVSTRWAGPFVISSTDGGTTWAPGRRVSQESNVLYVSAPLLHASGPIQNVVWSENRATGTLWTNRSVDGGATWQAHDLNLGHGLPSGFDAAPTLIASGPELHVFWARQSPAPETMYQRSTDAGATWLHRPQVLAPAAMVRAAGDQTHLMVTDAAGAYTLRSLDRGLTWTPCTGHGITQVVDLAVSGPHALLVGRRGTTYPMDVQLQVSNDAGATWRAEPYVVPLWRGANITARTTGDADFVHFEFASDQFRVPGAVIQSEDSGDHWRLVDGDAGRGLWTSDDGAIVMTRTGWNGTDVRAWVLEGHTSYGQGSPGTGGQLPSLAGRDLAGLGRTCRLVLGNARGGSVGALFTSFDALASAPFGAATLYVQAPIVTSALATDGVPGTAGVGGAEVLVTIPADPAFAGYTIRSQAFVLDPAVADGFAATRAVETWLR